MQQALRVKYGMRVSRYERISSILSLFEDLVLGTTLRLLLTFFIQTDYRTEDLSVERRNAFGKEPLYQR
jgi:hypothetical protein